MKPLRALVVEDSEDDTELLLRELKRGGYEPTHARVDTSEAMSATLAARAWDIVFSDFTMPHFNAFDALALLRGTGLDIPFIIVSGTIGEDRAVIAMKAGAHDYILKGNLKRLVPAVERELREAHVRKERRMAEETIRRLAYTDPVTELPNRARFLEQAQQAAEAARDKGHPLALLLMDLERFRDVNDTLGHARGDVLLQQVGTRLQGALFAPDTVARLGGDEFGILLPRLTATDDVKLVIKKLQDFLQAPFMIDGIPIAVEASIGVALAPDHAADAETMLQRADIAMYRAKQMATGYAIYTPEYDRHNPERLGLMAELRDAIERDQLLLHFQPKVEIGTGQVVGTEALVRWQHPRLGLLTPDKFIETAEHTGLITLLTRWVLTDALNHCQGARREGIRLRVSVNLSARSLHDPHLPEMVKNALKTTGAEAHQLILEITESAIVLDPKRAEETLATLSRMGVWLSIDDFGTGYTSLASLRHLPVNEVKIDKSFVGGMLANKSDAMIVRSVIELGHNLGLRIVAEGVETKAMLDALAALGCDEAQGYFISKPQACGPLKNWLPTSSWKIGSVA
ncbi:MAG: EAL domain-containing protein [Gammaproteobacteria bacterium]|nr:MAG: EAL domain-containing protein [Gammaproteobacteria bacterium]